MTKMMTKIWPTNIVKTRTAQGFQRLRSLQKRKKSPTLTALFSLNEAVFAFWRCFSYNRKMQGNRNRKPKRRRGKDHHLCQSRHRTCPGGKARTAGRFRPAGLADHLPRLHRAGQTCVIKNSRPITQSWSQQSAAARSPVASYCRHKVSSKRCIRITRTP